MTRRLAVALLAGVAAVLGLAAAPPLIRNRNRNR